MTDQQFVRAFALMIGGFTVLTLVLIALAAAVGGTIDEKLYAAAQGERDRAIAARVEPVGKLNVGEAPAAAPATTVAAAAVDGKGTYDSACAACHTAGVAGAPKLGDAAAWGERIAQGAEQLHLHAINGYQGKVGYMPPRGGNASLSDDAVKAAVDYMVEQSQ